MGNTEALQDMVRTHYSRVFAYCLSILMNREMAEDACHDVFLKVQQHIGTIDSGKNTTAWLFRIARNHCYDIYRKEKRSIAKESLENILEERSMGPEELLLQKEKVRSVIEGLKRLKPEYREVLVLRDMEGLSYREIARHLCIERTKVKWMLYKARQKLEKVVGDMK